MTPRYPRSAVIVSRASYESEDPYEIVQSNIDCVNSQLEAYLHHDELSENALRSYYVDYFLAELNNGGFSQFVYNSRWGECIDYVTAGFLAMKAQKHHELFESAAQKMEQRPGIAGLQKFFASEYFGENEERDILNEFNDDFFALEETEELVELNASWLKQLPDLVVLSDEEMAEEVEQRSNAIPDREQRVAAALAAEPPYAKIIRALCAAAGHEFNCVTAGDPAREYDGQELFAWHFLTDQGHFHMLELGDRAVMFREHTDEIVCEVEIPNADPS